MGKKSIAILILILCLGLVITGCAKKTVIKGEPSIKKAEEAAVAEREKAAKLEGEKAARERKLAEIREEGAKRAKEKEFEKSLVAKKEPGIAGEVIESKPLAEKPAKAPKAEEILPSLRASKEGEFAGKQLKKPKLAKKPAEPPALSPLQPDFSKIVGDELKRLSLGRILFNPSKEMKVGIMERVEVRIAKTISEDLSARLRGRGVPQIEEIRVGTFMKVRLTGNNFDIKSLSHEDQPVTGEGFTQWDWDVVPLKSGNQSLLLSVTVRIKIPNDGEETKDYPVFEREIKVKVNLIYSTKNFIKSYWQWIVSAIIASGIIGWVIRKWKGKI
jgi:hypothetical protein